MLFLSLLILAGCFQNIFQITGQEILVVRHLDGDIFTIKDSCESACSDLSSDTASPYKRQSLSSSSITETSSSSSGVNSTCVCQCNAEFPLFREDLHICVSDLHECRVSGFLSSSGTIEKIPYVFLPQQGQIIYPESEIQFQGVASPVCGIAGAQQLGKSGWSELRNLSSTESPFRLFKDEGKNYLQWIGEKGLRETAEGKVVMVRLVCRDASPNSTIPGVFTPCVVFRIAGSPSKSNIREVTFMSTTQTRQGLSTIEYTAIGISSVLLALIYVASVSLYLYSRRARKKMLNDPEVTVTNTCDGPSIIKNNPLLVVGRHFDTDCVNSIHSESDQENDVNLHKNESQQQHSFEKITSAIIHPHVTYIDEPESSFGSAIIAERLPEEDVRIVETIDNIQQPDLPILPGAQRRKLYFNPAYFDRQLLLAPPPAAIEFILKIREVIAIAKHKLCAKRFVPSLSGIPEEEIFLERDSLSYKRSNSIQSTVTKSKKSQKCTGCPGCLETHNQNVPPALPDSVRQIQGDNRVRAWLEDIKPPERRWRDLEDNQKNFRENVRTFARSFDYIKTGGNLFKSEHSSISSKPLSSWKDNPPMLRTFQNIARSEILDDDDRHSMSKQSTKSMFENTNYDRFCRTKRSDLQKSISPSNTINAKVRKAIENSFIKQMEENAALEIIQLENNNEHIQNEQRFSPDGSSEKINVESFNSITKSPNIIQKKKIRTIENSHELPDMIPELPAAKLQAKRIMDAVIKEMVDVKALEHHVKSSEIVYEVDSLERINRQAQELKEEISHTSNNLSKQSKDKNFKSKTEENILRKNYYNNLPELISQKTEGYALVSEVYVNDGYASPANSDDSGPEICYKSEQPGYLTIKVQDSPENYVKHDESEYEPDTLDRKPMKLKINGDVIYDKDQSSNETYVDSLERPTQILLKSKGSFRNDGNCSNGSLSLTKGCASLRQIYEAKLRSNIDSNLLNSTGSLNKINDDHLSWKSTKKYLTPDSRHIRRQRKQLNQPDVVPIPSLDNVYQHPKPPKQVDTISNYQKNAQDRSLAKAGNPTASQSPSVHLKNYVGTEKNIEKNFNKLYSKGKVEDSGYLSSTESSESHHNIHFNNCTKKELHKYEIGSVSETDETESICDGASESGAESVDTDSVFFGNFRRLSNVSSNISKSLDSGVDIEVKSPCSVGHGLERHTGIVNASDSENESFITVLSHDGSCNDSLQLYPP